MAYTQLEDLMSLTRARVTMRWLEPYFTEGVNKKLGVTVPHGLYRGWRLKQSALNLHVTLEADTAYQDHVAVSRVTNGSALTVRIEGGDFQLDLSSVTNNTVVVTIAISSIVGAATQAELRAYTLGDWNSLSATAKDELVVLGTVVVPNSGIIYSASISHERRNEAWSNVAPSAVPWAGLVKNSGFEWGPTSDARLNLFPPWENTEVTYGTWTLEATDAAAGTQCLQLTSITTPAEFMSGEVVQVIAAPLNNAEYVRLVASVKNVQAILSGGLTAVIRFRDVSGTAVDYVELLSGIGPVDSDYRKIDKTITIPAGTQLGELKLVATNLVVPSLGAAVRIDAVQLFVETQSTLFAHPEADTKGPVVASDIFLMDASAGGGAQAARISIDPGTVGITPAVVTIGRNDGDNSAPMQPSLEVKGSVTAGGGLTVIGGVGSLPGIKGIGGPTDGDGVEGQGTGVGRGVYGHGSGGSAVTPGKASQGVLGVGGAGGIGVEGVGEGSAVGMKAQGGPTGAGIEALGGSTLSVNAHGLLATAGNGGVGVWGRNTSYLTTQPGVFAEAYAPRSVSIQAGSGVIGRGSTDASYNGPGIDAAGGGFGAGGFFRGGTVAPADFTIPERVKGAGVVSYGGANGAHGIVGTAGTNSAIGTVSVSVVDKGIVGVGTGTDGTGVFGVSPATANKYGVWGRGSDGVSAHGVLGEGSAGNDGIGVKGQGTGVAVGVFGLGASSVASPTFSGQGVLGLGGGSNGVGVEGAGKGTGFGIFGRGAGALTAPTLTASNAGVVGIAGSGGGAGLIGEGSGAGSGAVVQGGSSGHGIEAKAGGANNSGVVADGNGSGVGVIGRAAGASTPAFGGQGVVGVGASAISGAMGVHGVGGATDGVGVLGDGIGTGPGVVGRGAVAVAPAFSGEGVLGVGAAGVSGASGVKGIGGATAGAGVWGEGSAAGSGGHFIGGASGYGIRVLTAANANGAYITASGTSDALYAKSEVLTAPAAGVRGDGSSPTSNGVNGGVGGYFVGGTASGTLSTGGTGVVGLGGSGVQTQGTGVTGVGAPNTTPTALAGAVGVYGLGGQSTGASGGSGGKFEGAAIPPGAPATAGSKGVEASGTGIGAGGVFTGGVTSPTGPLDFSTTRYGAGVIATATAANAIGIIGTGGGATPGTPMAVPLGAGVLGVAGASSFFSAGVVGVSATNGPYAVYGYASAGSNAVGCGGTASGFGWGVYGQGGATGPIISPLSSYNASYYYGAGAYGEGRYDGLGIGVVGRGGTATDTGFVPAAYTSVGVLGVGTLAAPGVVGVSGNTNNAYGIVGRGSSNPSTPKNTHGVLGVGHGTGYGVRGEGASAGSASITTDNAGVVGIGGSGGGYGVAGEGGSNNPGGYFKGGPSGAHGVYGLATNSYSGVYGISYGTAAGIYGTTGGTGPAAHFYGTASGIDGQAIRVDGSGFGTSGISFRGTNPTYNHSNGKNILTGKNVLKAWAAISFYSGVGYIEDGFNVSSVSHSAGYITLSYVNPIGPASVNGTGGNYAYSGASKVNGAFTVTTAPLSGFDLITDRKIRFFGGSLAATNAGRFHITGYSGTTVYFRNTLPGAVDGADATVGWDVYDSTNAVSITPVVDITGAPYVPQIQTLNNRSTYVQFALVSVASPYARLSSFPIDLQIHVAVYGRQD